MATTQQALDALTDLADHFDTYYANSAACAAAIRKVFDDLDRHVRTLEHKMNRLATYLKKGA